MKRELLSVVTIAALTTTPFAFASEKKERGQVFTFALLPLFELNKRELKGHNT